jgi:hypothetical protein
MARPALFPWTLCLVALAAIAWLGLHTRTLAREAGELEVALRAARARADAPETGSGARAAADENLALRQRLEHVETELRRALEHSAAIGEWVTGRAAAERAAREERQAALEAATAPPPEGVRLCLLALHQCLKADGFHGMRFLGARELADAELRSLELLDDNPETLITALYLAERMTVTLDRGRGALLLRMFGGHKLEGGRRHPFPPEGMAIVLEPVTGPLWEERLPFLVRSEGAYPVELPRAERPDAIDAQTRVVWLERLNGLLARAGTDDRLRVKDFRGMADGRFLQASLAGYDGAGLLRTTAAARDLCVEVDVRAGVVQLCLRDGTLRGPGGNSTISPEGYRMLLPEITVRDASDAMLGMVVRR